MKLRDNNDSCREREQMLVDTDYFVLDMDGTFYCSDAIIDGSLEFLETLKQCGKHFIFFTNNSSKAPKEYIDKLERMGCIIDRQQIMTSGDVAIQYLKSNYPGKSVFLMGTPELEADFIREGILLTKEMPDIVLVAFDQTLTYERLERGCTYIREGALYLSTHPDINCPVQNGFIPDSGSICAAVSLSTGKQPKYLGKPYGETVDMILERLQAPLEKVAFVGDRLYTDIAVGVNHGAKGFLVMSGETKEEDLADSKTQPDAVFKNLGEMGEILRQAYSL